MILTGGVSVGDHDHVKHVLADLAARRRGGSARWMRVAVRPAKPLMFATIRGVPVLGLAGQPGERVRQLPPVRSRRCSTASPATATARRDARSQRPRRVDLPRGPTGGCTSCRWSPKHVAGQLVDPPGGTADRHHLAATAAANAYAYLPDGPRSRAGELVECSWIEPR